MCYWSSKKIRVFIIKTNVSCKLLIDTLYQIMKFPSITNSLIIVFINGYFFLMLFLYLLTWTSEFSSLICYYNALIDFQILNQPFISGINARLIKWFGKCFPSSIFWKNLCKMCIFKKIFGSEKIWTWSFLCWKITTASSIFFNIHSNFLFFHLDFSSLWTSKKWSIFFQVMGINLFIVFPHYSLILLGLC